MPSPARMLAMRSCVGKLEHRRTSSTASTRCCNAVSGLFWGASSTGEAASISGAGSSAKVFSLRQGTNRVKMTSQENSHQHEATGMAPSPSERVPIVEDEPSTRVGLTELVRTWGFTADSAGDGEEALQRITVVRASIIISDLVMPRRDGLELLRSLKDDGSDYTVVILTAQGTVETAVEAMKEGAYDYLTKPIEPQRLKILLDKIVERQDTLREVKVLRKQLREHGTYGKMIGSSPQMRKVYQIIEQAAPTSASVLISGESGTGKELVAQTIHQLSPRSQMPFVPINCA